MNQPNSGKDPWSARMQTMHYWKPVKRVKKEAKRLPLSKVLGWMATAIGVGLLISTVVH